jgi:outer membrane protein OmpA-like peptidoglycan-associated protein
LKTLVKARLLARLLLYQSANGRILLRKPLTEKAAKGAQTMKNFVFPAIHLRGTQLATLLLLSALGASASAQSARTSGTVATAQSVQSNQDGLSSDAQEPPVPYSAAPVKPAKEGFWGRVNPFARKKWVKNQIDPITGQISELNEVNGKNSRDIRDVDSRARAGISRAQSTADDANQTATAAGSRAQLAHTTAQNAMNHVDGLTTTVNGLDTYGQLAEVDVLFRGGQPVLSAAARKTLDDLAAKVTGQPGYILEVEAHSPAAGAVGIQNSERLAEVVKRYLVTEHDIPVYRMHAVALGNARSKDDDGDNRPIHLSSVHIRLMENSLAAQGASSPQSAASLTGTERP